LWDLSIGHVIHVTSFRPSCHTTCSSGWMGSLGFCPHTCWDHSSCIVSVASCSVTSHFCPWTKYLLWGVGAPTDRASRYAC